MNLKLFILNFLCFISTFVVGDDKVYTWKSKNGSITYSDKPYLLLPSKSKNIIVHNNMLSKDTDNSSDENNDGIAQNQATEWVDNTDDTAYKSQNCEIAQKNLQISQASTSLSNKDKKIIIEQYKNDITQYCD